MILSIIALSFFLSFFRSFVRCCALVVGCVRACVRACACALFLTKKKIFSSIEFFFSLKKFLKFKFQNYFFFLFFFFFIAIIDRSFVRSITR